MSTTWKPGSGLRYKVSREITIDGAGRHKYKAVVTAQEDRDFNENLYAVDEWTWEEVEPEYVEGALYQDADGSLYKRDSNYEYDGTRYPWLLNGDRQAGGCLEQTPRRPLIRLYREDEKRQAYIDGLVKALGHVDDLWSETQIKKQILAAKKELSQ